jgi:hypothetical protein
MSRDPLALIWERLDTEPPIFFAERPDPEFANTRDRLISSSFLRETEPGQFAVCLACGGGHVRRVAWVEDPRSGERSPYLPCPNCGSVRIEPERLQRWIVDVPRLLTEVFGVAGGRIALNELVPHRLWYVGSATWLGRSRQVYFVRATHVHSRPAVLAALNPHPRAILFHPTEHAVRLWGTTTANPTVALESVVTFGPTGLTFHAAVVEGRLADAGYAEPKPKPPRKRGEPAAKIELLVREVSAHLHAARAHAFSLQDLGREPELLPRPTQKELAERCGLSKTGVSRCVNDPDAKLLQLLWETALHLDQVMMFHGPIGGGSEG